MFILLANFISIIANLFVFLIFINALLSFFLSPYNPVRSVLGRIIDPLLAPIRRVVPLIGPLDFSPWILIILVEIVARVLVSILSAL